MSVNASACYLKILVGADQQDWSLTLKSFDVSLPKRDRGGLLPITGALTLTYSDDAPESMNPRINGDRWHRGQSVRVLASLDGVSYVPHPCGWLYILKEPLPPHPDAPELALQVGCKEALKDYAEPDNDKSGVILGVATSRTDAIASILLAAGITTWVGAVPDYPIAHPLPKIGGSYVQQAGKVAYAGQKALWQDNQGQIQAIDLRLDPAAAPVVDITIGVGGGEIVYKPSEGSETPVEELRCVGLDKIGIDTWRCLSSLPNEHYETTNEGGAVSTRILRRTTITDCQGLNDAGQFYKSRREFVEETAGMVYPNDEPASLRLTFSSDSTTTYLYEPGVTGRLINTHRLVLRPTAAAVASWWANLSAQQKLSYSRISPLPATDELTTFSYQDYPTPQDGSVADQYAFNYQTQVVAGQTVATKSPIAAIAPNEDLSNVDPLLPQPSGVTTESWAKVRGYEWQKTTIAQAPFITAAPEAAANSTSLSSKIALVTTDQKTDVSAAGGQQPSAPERRPDRYTEIEIQVKGRALFGTPAGSNEQKRFRCLEVEYMVSSEQASAIAATEGALLIGRRQGQTILVPFDDRFLSVDEAGHGFAPLQIWRCTEPDGTTYIYQADAISFTHDPDRAVVGCEGIWLATIPAGAMAPKLPYSQINPLSGGLRLGGSFRAYPYSLATRTSMMLGGSRLGGRLSPVTTVSMRGGSRLGGQLRGSPTTLMQGGLRLGGSFAFAGVKRSFSGGLRLGGSVRFSRIQTALRGGICIGGKLSGRRSRLMQGGLRLGGSCVAQGARRLLFGGLRVGGQFIAANVDFMPYNTITTTTEVQLAKNNGYVLELATTTATVNLLMPLTSGLTAGDRIEFYPVKGKASIKPNAGDQGYLYKGILVSSIPLDNENILIGLVYSGTTLGWLPQFKYDLAYTVYTTPPSSAIYTVTQTSSFGPPATYATLTDGDLSTGATTDSSGIVYCTFPYPITVTGIKIAGGSNINGNGQAAPNGIQAQYSLDGSTGWTTAVTTSGTNNSGTLFQFDFTSVTAQYWRFTVPGGYAWFSELRFLP